MAKPNKDGLLDAARQKATQEWQAKTKVMGATLKRFRVPYTVIDEIDALIAEGRELAYQKGRIDERTQK